MKTLAISNHKGGVGKTATSHALGAILAENGRRVLLVDLDPQASLTSSCGIDGGKRANMTDVLGDMQPGAASMRSILCELGTRLWLAPADISLAGTELGLQQRLGRENVLRRALATVAGDFDVCVVDCLPGLGLLTVNGLVAADAVLIPTQPQGADLRALNLFLGTLDRVRELNPDLAILGVLVTFYDGRLLHHKDAVEALTGAGLPILPVTIGRSVRVAEAAAAGQSLIAYDPRNPQAAAYRELAKVIETWLETDHR